VQLTPESTPVAELQLVEPTAGQIEAAMKEPYAVTSNIMLIAAVAKVSPAEVRAMVTSGISTRRSLFLSGFYEAGHGVDLRLGPLNRRGFHRAPAGKLAGAH